MMIVDDGVIDDPVFTRRIDDCLLGWETTTSLLISLQCILK